MPMRSVLSDEEETEINLSPMIDCIFILLIFFIVTTVFVEEKGLQVAKPDGAAAASLVEQDNVVVEVTADNKLWVDEREISLADLRARVEESAQGEDVPVVIRAHEKVAHGFFVSVWDAAKQGGAQQLSFITVN